MAAGHINLDAYSDALIVLGTAGIVVPIVQRWRVSPVLVYLAAGAKEPNNPCRSPSSPAVK